MSTCYGWLGLEAAIGIDFTVLISDLKDKSSLLGQGYLICLSLKKSFINTHTPNFKDALNFMQ